MASSNEEVVTGLDGLAVERAPQVSLAARARALYELGKPNLSGLVVISGVLGFYLGSGGARAFDWARCLHFAAGTALTAAGACALNMYLERDLDRQMRRTRGRPIPSGRVSAESALVFSVVTFCLGLAELAIFTGPIPALLSLATLLIYAFVYTPMKRRGPVSIWIGAIPGAIPPVMGHAAVQGEIGAGGLALFAILFTWQFPHFLALAWMYRDDYARAGFRFLPEAPRGGGSASSLDPGARTGRNIALGCLALITASVTPWLIGTAGVLYLVGALLAGAAFLLPCVRVALDPSNDRARAAFIASVTYLPMLLALLVLDRVVG